MYGESASLKCSVKGEVNPHILWISPTNRAITSASDKYLIHNDGTLFIHNVQRFDGGNYTCLARNSAGQDKKVYRLEILVSPPAINGLRGSTNSLKNVVLPAPYYGAGMTVHRNGTLDIQSLKVTDAAFLTCIAQNEGGEAKLIIQLDVLDTIEKPRLRSPKMESLSLTVGRTLTLNCSVEGSPAPQVTWVLPGGTRAGRYTVLQNGTLSIQQASVYDRGSYTCRTANEYGSSLLTISVIIIAYPPRITSSPAATTYARRGVAVQLNCVVLLLCVRKSQHYFDRTIMSITAYIPSVYEVLLNLSIKA
uniref:Ig-like domain-containing protein n=1 Tax=Electrophorus electricus TaxID=8005 RepID=A0AAY5ECU8_ELEEL